MTQTIKQLMLFFLCCFFSGIVQAQLTWTWPQYTLKGEPVRADSNFLTVIPVRGHNYMGDTTISSRIQSIYMPYMFPNAPDGNVANLYFRIYGIFTQINTAHVNPCVYDSVEIHIGYSEDSVFGVVPVVGTKLAFKKNLPLVYQAQSLALYDLDSTGSQGAWLKIPLIPNSFHFQHDKNFVVEWIGGPRLWTDGMDFHVRRCQERSGSNYVSRTLTAYDGFDSTQDVGIGIVLAIGFDITPTGVTEQSNIQGVGLFPNPAPNGRFNISLDAKQAMQEVRVTISDITGRQIQGRQFAHPGTHFFEEINLSSAAPGIYFVRIEADGTVITRRVSVE